LKEYAKVKFAEEVKKEESKIEQKADKKGFSKKTASMKEIEEFGKERL